MLSGTKAVERFGIGLTGGEAKKKHSETGASWMNVFIIGITGGIGGLLGQNCALGETLFKGSFADTTSRPSSKREA